MLLVIGAVGTYLVWDYLPERVQYIPRYLQANFLPERAHAEFVATPVGVAAPEQALESLQLPSRVEPTAPAAPVEEAAAPEPVATPEAAVTDPAPAVDPAAEAPPAEPAEAEPVAPEAAAPVVEAGAPPAPAVAFAQAGPSAMLQGIRHEYQGWNNCGPATLAMTLSYYGRTETQEVTAPFLKPSADDKNVSPDEMAAYAHSIGYGAEVLVGGDLALLRTLVANGIPVIVESWYIPDPNDEMGHYLLLAGYEGETLTFFDSYHGPNVQEPAAEFDALWKVFNRTMIVTWPPEKEALARSILGDRSDREAMYQRALETAHVEVQANPQDKFAWFNLGTNLTALGDIANATTAFDTARSLQLPWRMLWYQFGPYDAYFQAGEYQEVIGLATTTLKDAGNLEESYYWRGRAQAALGQNDAARADFQQAIKLNANFTPAQEALASLP